MKLLNSFKFWFILNKVSLLTAIIAVAVSFYCVGWMGYTYFVVSKQSHEINVAKSENKSREFKGLDFIKPGEISKPVDWSTIAPRAQTTTVLISVAGDQFKHSREKVNGFVKNNLLEQSNNFYRIVFHGKKDWSNVNSTSVSFTPQGAGVIVDDKGTILTAAHVVDGYHLVLVATTEGRQGIAKVVMIDEMQDLAVIKLIAEHSEHSELKGDFGSVAKLANTAKLPAGTPIIQIGAPNGEAFAVSSGIIMGTKQNFTANIYDDLIQIDAKTAGGNSGGGVFNRNGELLGISSFATTSGAFSIPIDRAKKVLALAKEKIESQE